MRPRGRLELPAACHHSPGPAPCLLHWRCGACFGGSLRCGPLAPAAVQPVQEEFEAGVTAMKAVSEREKHAKETGEAAPAEGDGEEEEKVWPGWGCKWEPGVGLGGEGSRVVADGGVPGGAFCYAISGVLLPCHTMCTACSTPPLTVTLPTPTPKPVRTHSAGGGERGGEGAGYRGERGGRG